MSTPPAQKKKQGVYLAARCPTIVASFQHFLKMVRGGELYVLKSPKEAQHLFTVNYSSCKDISRRSLTLYLNGPGWRSRQKSVVFPTCTHETNNNML